MLDSVCDDCDFLETSTDICDLDSSHSSRITSWTDVRGIIKLVWVFRCDLGILDGVLPLSDISDNFSSPSIFCIFIWFWNWRICFVAELVFGKLNWKNCFFFTKNFSYYIPLWSSLHDFTHSVLRDARENWRRFWFRTTRSSWSEMQLIND